MITREMTDYFNEYEDRYHQGELYSADSIKVNDTLKYITPKGKVVYGGGGIVPDVFVAIDTTRYFDVRHYRALNDFVFDYTDTHRDDFKGITLDTFIADFDPGNKIWNAYLENVPDELRTIQDFEKINIENYLKALMAQQLFDINAFYRIINEDDIIINKVKELDKEGSPIVQ